jgi:endothelin-converting enzyme
MVSLGVSFTLSVKETEALVPEISFTDIISSLAPHDYKGDRLIVGSPSYPFP